MTAIIWSVMVALLGFVELHRVDGGVIFINPTEVTMLMVPRSNSEKLSHPGARCVVFTTDGRTFSVAEPCEQIRGLLRPSELPRE